MLATFSKRFIQNLVSIDKGTCMGFHKLNKLNSNRRFYRIRSIIEKVL